jgi:gas vesicle protein
MKDNRHSYFLCGLAAGAAAGLLWAPKPGFKLRARIAKSAREGQDFIKQQGDEIRDAVQSTMKRGKRVVKETTAGVRKGLQEGRAALMG